MFDIKTRFQLTLEEVSYTENEYTHKAVEVLTNRLANNDFSEFTEEESDAIAYALAFDEE